MPSEQIIGTFVLRGYRGPAVMVSAEPYFKSVKLDSFVENHAHAMLKKHGKNLPSVELDIIRLEELAHSCDAVRVLPTG